MVTLPGESTWDFRSPVLSSVAAVAVHGGAAIGSSKSDSAGSTGEALCTPKFQLFGFHIKVKTHIYHGTRYKNGKDARIRREMKSPGGGGNMVVSHERWPYGVVACITNYCNQNASTRIHRFQFHSSCLLSCKTAFTVDIFRCIENWVFLVQSLRWPISFFINHYLRFILAPQTWSPWTRCNRWLGAVKPFGKAPRLCGIGFIGGTSQGSSDVGSLKSRHVLVLL